MASGKTTLQFYDYPILYEPMPNNTCDPVGASPTIPDKSPRRINNVARKRHHPDVDPQPQIITSTSTNMSLGNHETPNIQTQDIAPQPQSNNSNPILTSNHTPNITTVHPPWLNQMLTFINDLTLARDRFLKAQGTFKSEIQIFFSKCTSANIQIKVKKL